MGILFSKEEQPREGNGAGALLHLRVWLEASCPLHGPAELWRGRWSRGDTEAGLASPPRQAGTSLSASLGIGSPLLRRPGAGDQAEPVHQGWHKPAPAPGDREPSHAHGALSAPSDSPRDGNGTGPSLPQTGARRDAFT